MTPSEALEIVVGRTGHVRYRQLCDKSHPDYDPGCEPTMIALATGMTSALETARPLPCGESLPLNESLRLLALMRGCPWRDERTDCGCAGLATCAVGLGTRGLVNHQDCMECLRTGAGASSG